MTNIYIHVSGTLNELITLSSRGYNHHVSGIIKPANVTGLISRFEELYDTNLTKYQRQYRRRKGQCNVQLVLHPRYTTPDFQWWLLATDGEGLFHDREKTRDARKSGKRLGAFNQFQAIKMPAKGSVPRWTWRLDMHAYSDWEARIRASIDHSDDINDFKNTMRQLHSLPGFRGVRGQVANLRKVTLCEWKRVTGQDFCPYLPKSKQPYLRYKTYNKVPVELVVERLKAGKSPYAIKWKTEKKYE